MFGCRHMVNPRITNPWRLLALSLPHCYPCGFSMYLHDWVVGGFNPSETYGSPLEWLFPTYGNPNIPNHQPAGFLYGLNAGKKNVHYPNRKATNFCQTQGHWLFQESLIFWIIRLFATKTAIFWSWTCEQNVQQTLHTSNIRNWICGTHCFSCWPMSTWHGSKHGL